MRRARWILAALLLPLAGCLDPVYVDQNSALQPPDFWPNQVVYQVHKPWEAAPPACIAILPLNAGEAAAVAPEDSARVRIALFAHLAPQGRRQVTLARIDHVLGELPKNADRLRLLGERLRCPALLTGTVTDYGSSYLGIYSSVTVGADLKLIRAADGAVLWEGRHTASSRGGGVGLSAVGVAMGLFDAASNLRDEQILRVTDDLARRLASTIPDDVIAAYDDPAAEPVRLAVPPPLAPAAGPGANSLALGERRLAEGDHAGALAAAEAAIAIEPGRSQGYLLKGRVLLAEGDFDRAEPAILAAVARDRSNAIALNALGFLNGRKGAPDRALAAYRLAIAADPADGFAYYNSAVIHFNANNWVPAADHFYGAALAYLKKGDYGRAEKALADLRDLSREGVPLDHEIATIDDALGALTRRKS